MKQENNHNLNNNYPTRKNYYKKNYRKNYKRNYNYKNDDLNNNRKVINQQKLDNELHNYMSQKITGYTYPNNIYIPTYNPYLPPTNYIRAPYQQSSYVHNLVTAYNNAFTSQVYNQQSQVNSQPYQINQETQSIQQSLNRSNETKKKLIVIDVDINNIADILNIIDLYELNDTVEYNINMKLLHSIKEPLNKLNNMIGMSKMKSSLVNQILYYTQNLHNNIDNNNQVIPDTINDNDLLHTCIYGSPGTGKTEIAKLIGEIYSNMGILKKKVFKKVTRADLIAGYLGQTAIKTKEVINSCLGGVLFIDEAYSLGNTEKKDSFAKECIDTLCEALSDKKQELMVIIAGYEEELNKCFFSMNSGLESRFNWRFKTDDYSADELRKILLEKIKLINWTIKDNNIDNVFPLEWFNENKKYFTFFGRDIETLLTKIKIAHSKRVFCLEEKEKRVITNEDLVNGFSIFLENEQIKKRVNNSMPEYIQSMFY